MRTVIFDLDGTLADTSGDLIAAANACFRGHGRDDVLDPERDRETSFLGARAMLRLGAGRLGLPEEQADGMVPAFLDFYSGAIDVHTRLYPGMVAAVEGLRTVGYAVGICTNKPAEQAEDLLARLGIRELFASMVGAGTLPVRKPDPAPYRAAVERAGGAVERSLLVGDTVTDRDTARAAGVPCVLVDFHSFGDAIAAMKPDAVLRGYDALASVVSELIG